MIRSACIWYCSVKHCSSIEKLHYNSKFVGKRVYHMYSAGYITFKVDCNLVPSLHWLIGLTWFVIYIHVYTNQSFCLPCYWIIVCFVVLCLNIKLQYHKLSLATIESICIKIKKREIRYFYFRVLNITQQELNFSTYIFSFYFTAHVMCSKIMQ